MIKQLILISLFFFFVKFTYGQKVLVQGGPSTGKLKWSDFTGKPDKNSSFAAFTFYNTGWKMKGARASGDSMLIEGFEMTVELNHKSSWVKLERATPDLLLHEQGHFNMGILSMREILDTIKRTKFTQANMKESLPQLIASIAKKYRELGELYDKETDHSKNTAMQKKWNSFFAERLPELYQ